MDTSFCGCQACLLQFLEFSGKHPPPSSYLVISKIFTSESSPEVKNCAFCSSVEYPSGALCPTNYDGITLLCLGMHLHSRLSFILCSPCPESCPLSFEHHSSCMDKLWFDFLRMTSAALLQLFSEAQVSAVQVDFNHRPIWLVLPWGKKVCLFMFVLLTAMSTR